MILGLVTLVVLGCFIGWELRDAYRLAKFSRRCKARCDRMQEITAALHTATGDEASDLAKELLQLISEGMTDHA